jgi:hypothetical protein
MRVAARQRDACPAVERIQHLRQQPDRSRQRRAA